LKFPHGLGVRSAGAVHLQNEFLKLFLHWEPF
jgi:hypothetical protein